MANAIKINLTKVEGDNVVIHVYRTPTWNIDSSGIIKEEYTYEAENFACPVNYSQALKSSYDMTYICFSLEADITELSGSYDMILEIENTQDGTTYRDIVNMSTETKEFSPLALNDKTYAVEKTGSLNKNILKVR